MRIIRLFRPPVNPMPLYAHTVGYNKQNPMKRPEGFSTHQLLFSRSGKGRISIAGHDEFVLGPMQYLYLPAELPHEYHPAGDEEWVVGYVSFSGTRISPLMEHFGIHPCLPYDCPDIDLIWCTLDELWELADANEEGAEWDGARMMYGLFLDMERMKTNNPLEKEVPVLLDSDPAGVVVRQTAQYLNEHYNENISLSNVAQSLGYTHQYLNRLFRQTYGLSMLQYVQKMRLGKAIDLMKSEAGMPVKDIAKYVGMETNYFIRMFRKATGKTPDHYRKEMLQSR
ncbi:AraC family transcriptional regulator [Paenibacillus dokdonensis]|uniref:AraC family transcriptional regulator n=1 Tax=Paenibacillus dokdonensis TaxID=2567944 RepID=UPI001FE6C9C9|nr:AraC family transcriptional regulator [Paenibacillus dokdonensis]